MKENRYAKNGFGKNTNSWYLHKKESMARNTSVLLGEHFDKFIAKEIASGRYSSASEVIRTALRLLEARENKIKQLKKALDEGEKSGFIKNFDRKVFLKKLHDKLK